MRKLAMALLFLLIAAPVAFMIWLNLNYWTGMSGDGNGWQVACFIFDVIAISGGVVLVMMGIAYFIEWIVDTIWGP